MRLIDRLPPPTISYRRADILAFWVLATVAIATIVGFAAALAEQSWAWGIAAACALLIPGVFWRPWFEGGITIWNTVARAVASAIRTYAMAVAYYVLFAAVGRAGSSLDIGSHPGGASKWWPVIDAQDDGMAAANRQRLMSWMQMRANVWAISLTPVLVLLRVLKIEQQDSAPPSSTYTLY